MQYKYYTFVFLFYAKLVGKNNLFINLRLLVAKQEKGMVNNIGSPDRTQLGS